MTDLPFAAWPSGAGRALSSSASPAMNGSSALRSSAEALETAFLAEMLKSAGIAAQTGTDSDAETEMPLASFMVDAYAEALMARGGIGLATHVERALALRQGEGGR